MFGLIGMDGKGHCLRSGFTSRRKSASVLLAEKAHVGRQPVHIHMFVSHQQHHDYISYLWTSYAQPPPTLSKVLDCEMAQHYNITQIETLPCHAMQQR